MKRKRCCKCLTTSKLFIHSLKTLKLNLYHHHILDVSNGSAGLDLALLGMWKCGGFETRKTLMCVGGCLMQMESQENYINSE